MKTYTNAGKVSNLKLLGTMVDHDNDVTTTFHLEQPGAAGERGNSTIRHLLAHSNDGRPDTAIPVSDSWSEADILMLLQATILLSGSDVKFTKS
jgi:hypothetical protein